jgi:hypothetical protein
VAVGDFARGALAERWDGSRWSRQRTAYPGADATFSGVSCTSPRECTAVGTYSNADGRQMPFAERWNGSSWSLQRIPDPDPYYGDDVDFSGVSCAGPRVCIAVGDTAEHALVDRWNGDTWTTQSTPGAFEGGDRFDAVSCPSITTCEAVGANATSGGIFAEGEVVGGPTNPPFQSVPDRAGPELGAVSCVSITACTAIGVAVARWNGLTWSIEPSPHNTAAELNAVSCTSKTTCVGVGQVEGPHHSVVPLIERRS